MKTMSSERIKFYKEKFPVGTRIQLDRMGDDLNPIPKGTKGTASYVDDLGSIFCKFDNGGRFAYVRKRSATMKPLYKFSFSEANTNSLSSYRQNLIGSIR